MSKWRTMIGAGNHSLVLYVCAGDVERIVRKKKKRILDNNNG